MTAVEQPTYNDPTAIKSDALNAQKSVAFDDRYGDDTGQLGADALRQKSALAQKDDATTGQLIYGRAKAEQKYLKGAEDAINSPRPPLPTYEKIKNEPNPEDYHKYSVEFASASALLGAIAGKWTRAGGTASLNAFAGAMQGWQKGNLQAYEEASKQWEQASKKTIDNNNIELAKYKAILEDRKMNIDEKLHGLTIAGYESQNSVIVGMGKDGNFNGIAQAVDKMAMANQRYGAAVGQLTDVRNDQREEMKGQIDALNADPSGAADLKANKPTEWFKIAGSAHAMGIELKEPPPVDTNRVQAAVDAVGQYKANPQTVLSRMPPQDRKMFWGQLQEKYPDWSQQTYNAQNVGGTAGARTEATRAANLDIILNSAKAAIPQALAASDAMPRGNWVPVNKAIQAMQAGTSDPKLAAFAVANLQIAELWARAMNPTGVMREGDRELALKNLNTATSPEAYRTVLNSVKQAMDREKGAVLTTEKERGARTNSNPDAGSLDPNASDMPPPPPGYHVQ